MQLSRGHSRRVGLDMTPLIDVVLMLVIFFMLTTSFVLSPGIKVDLPQGQSMQRTQDNDAVVIVTTEGTIYYRDERVDLERLHTALQQAHQEQPGVRLIVKADKRVQHGQVVEVMELAKSAGIERLAIATAPKQAPAP